MATFPETWVQVCGPLVLRVDGQRCEQDLRTRQVRELAAFLIVNRRRTVSRDELVTILWPEDVAPGAADSLNTLLSRLRKVCGHERIAGRGALRLSLPDDAWIDIEVAERKLHQAESLVAQGNFLGAWAPARIALATTKRGFLPDIDAPWTDQWRRHVEHMRLSAFEAMAESALGIGGAELGGAERAGRALIEAAPLRETGYRYLMEYFAARDDVGSSLQVYDSMRVQLREELGVAPSREAQQLHLRLLERTSSPH